MDLYVSLAGDTDGYPECPATGRGGRFGNSLGASRRELAGPGGRR